MIALDSRQFPMVVAIREGWPSGVPFNVDAQDLTPLPMKYFHGQVPA